jgi:catechol 1,2-dioxygenase
MRALSIPVLLIVAATIGRSQSKDTPSTSSIQPAPTAERLVGAWRLVSIETIRPNGAIIYPFYGKHPEGLLIYDRSGLMSVQIVSDPKPNADISSREGFLAASVADRVAVAEGYYAYFGRWTVDSMQSTVTHHLQESLYPGERGQEFVRHAKLEGNHLTLMAKVHEMGEDHERRLKWERLSSPSP